MLANGLGQFYIGHLIKLDVETIAAVEIYLYSTFYILP